MEPAEVHKSEIRDLQEPAQASYRARGLHSVVVDDGYPTARDHLPYAMDGFGTNQIAVV